MRNSLPLSFILFVSLGFSQDTDLRKNEYRYYGGAIACITGTEDSTSVDDSPCLRIGFIQIGSRISNVDVRFGEPTQIIPSGDKEIRVYELETKNELTGYMALTISGETISGIQITGGVPVEPLFFSSIGLGDSSSQIIRILGQPRHSEFVEENGSTLWSYRPFPFSFEIIHGRVFSIKIWQRNQ